MIKVVAAIIKSRNKFMICQRPKGKSRALLWEFPGGKVEKGETEELALIRECREELGVIIEPKEKDLYARSVCRCAVMTMTMRNAAERAFLQLYIFM